MGGEIPPHNFGWVVSHDQSLNSLRTINWPRWSHGGIFGAFIRESIAAVF